MSSRDMQTERVTFRLPNSQFEDLDDFVEESSEYTNRSDPVRDAIDAFLAAHGVRGDRDE